MSRRSATVRGPTAFPDVADGGDEDTRVSRVGGSQAEQLGDFRLGEKLAEGGMGVVYKARQVSMDRDVALKILPEHLARDPDFVDRFYREARMSAKLDHTNIIRGIAVGEAKGAHYFAMEFVDGESLDKLLARQGKVSVDDAIKIGIDIARALDHATSKGLVHRDIKPANIMITRDGTVKLADLGLAKTTSDDAGLTQHGAIFGTLSYMAPEQAHNAKEADIRSDIYALGGTLYHLLAGRRPYDAGELHKLLAAKEQGPPEPIRRHNPDVPRELERVLEKMMEPDPKHRFQSPDEVVAALERLRGFERTAAEPSMLSSSPAPAAWSLRNSHALWAAISAVVVLAVAYLVWPRPNKIEPEPVDVVVNRALAAVISNAPVEGRQTLAHALTEHPGAQEIERPLRELENGVLVLLQYQTPTETKPVVPLWASGGLTLTARDNYRFAIIPGRTCYLYAFQKDTRPSVTGLFPNVAYSRLANPLQAGTRYWLPSSRGTDDLWLHLDSSVGEERVYFLALTRPLRDVGLFTRRILDSEDELRKDLQTNLESFLQPGESPGASCFAGDVLQVLAFSHQ